MPSSGTSHAFARSTSSVRVDEKCAALKMSTTPGNALTKKFRNEVFPLLVS
jgi:hypothetical protein